MKSVLYEVVLRGRVGDVVAGTLEGFEVVSTDGGMTTLRGWVPDQSALHGMLDRIAGFHLEIKRLEALEESA